MSEQPLYLIAVTPPISQSDIQSVLEPLLEHPFVVALLPQYSAATITLHNEDYKRIVSSDLRTIRVQGKLLGISVEHPAPCFEESRFSLGHYKPGQQMVWKVVLTGGPCAGKTTALSLIASDFSQYGIQVYTVPEVATILINGGLSFANITQAQSLEYQTVLLNFQLQLEKSFMDIAAASGKKCLVICDRGCMDGKAYCSDETWATILNRLNMDETTLRDTQYDAVIHLVTAADGAESYYTNSNNSARSETVDQAKSQDAKTLQVYIGHPHLHILKNNSDFSTKMSRVLSILAETIGVALPTYGSYRRFLVKEMPHQVPEPAVHVDIEISVLKGSSLDQEMRLLRRTEGDRHVYTLQYLRRVTGRPVLTERKLTHKDYDSLLPQVDPEMEVIRKKSVSFVYNKQYFEMGVFVTPSKLAGTTLLYLQSQGKTDRGSLLPLSEIGIPPFITIEREVTTDKSFASSVMASRRYLASDESIEEDDLESSSSLQLSFRKNP